MSEEKIKTGTTCIGIKFKDGILIGADRRVTSYKINSDSFTKIFELSNNVVGTISGGVADAQRIIRIIKSELKLISLKNERNVYVNEAVMVLTNYQYSTSRTSGAIVGMIVGGYDELNGASLNELSPEGSLIPNQNYVAIGSGSIFVDGVLTAEYKENLTEKDALKLMEKCFISAFRNDTASGGGFIAKIITKEGIKDVAKKIMKHELVNE